MKTLMTCFLAGFFAALATVFGKLASNPNSIAFLPEISTFFLSFFPTHKIPPFITESLLLLPIFFFICMLLSNALMWTFYSKSLDMSPSSLLPTTLNLASNIICSVSNQPPPFLS
eukprot:Sdes_comp9261_c0_seq1m739